MRIQVVGRDAWEDVASLVGGCGCDGVDGGSDRVSLSSNLQWCPAILSLRRCLTE